MWQFYACAIHALCAMWRAQGVKAQLKGTSVDADVVYGQQGAVRSGDRRGALERARGAQSASSVLGSGARARLVGGTYAALPLLVVVPRVGTMPAFACQCAPKAALCRLSPRARPQQRGARGGRTRLGQYCVLAGLEVGRNNKTRAGPRCISSTWLRWVHVGFRAISWPTHGVAPRVLSGCSRHACLCL